MTSRIRRAAGVAAALAVTACSGGGDGPVRPPPQQDTMTIVPSPAAEARALWISRFDWADEGQLRALLENAAAANFNLIYLQVRGRADAYYRSSLEPWAHRPPAFTLGQDPGWDPLAVAVEVGAARGLEIHAWINALVGWCTREEIPETTPRHILLAHPEWKMVDQAGGDYVDNCHWITPGDPAARSHLAAVATDIVRRYPVAGVHLDYIRYPSTAFSYDAKSLEGYEAARAAQPALTFEQFRRDLVTSAVREVRDSLDSVRRTARLSAAVWGVYRNTAGWSGVSTGYDTRLQDSWGWAAAGIVDAIVPMIYWNIDPVYGDPLDFGYLADEFARGVSNRHVYLGMGAHAAGVDPSFCVACDPVRQIYRARLAGGEGVAIYSGQLVRAADLWQALATGPFQQRVPVPDMPWNPR